MGAQKVHHLFTRLMRTSQQVPQLFATHALPPFLSLAVITISVDVTGEPARRSPRVHSFR
ncbi:hypothetical protein DIZ27_36675 [Streptomyces sp. NWU339]|nr:hypothetical protein DIZ27_36675 [Streptomyces sp. NWU339]